MYFVIVDLFDRDFKMIVKIGVIVSWNIFRIFGSFRKVDSVSCGSEIEDNGYRFYGVGRVCREVVYLFW